mgnify:CR=1 FL=1
MKTAKPLTLGSLFDGIGGFPLAGICAGIRPVWASEIEPFPIRVTEKRLPEMKHCGDIHGLQGAKLEPVDMITFGSPCQDVSIAGRREGLSGGRSGLFFEAIRIIREMREATNGEYPRWAVWENVPGALSSHNGEDFRQVLESLIRVQEPEADVPLPADGKWLPAGEIMGNGYALAWRILDAAQGWGVAQRRKRVFVVLDLAGGRAGEVLFESEGLSGYTPPGGEARKGAAGGAARCAGAAGFCYESGEASRGIGYQEEESPTLRCWKPPGVAVREPPLTLKIRSGCDGGGKGALIQHDLSATLGCHNDQTLFAPKAFGVGSDKSKGMLSANPKSGFYEAATSRTLDRSGGNACCNQGGMVVVSPAYSIHPMVNTQTQQEQTPSLMARDSKDPLLVSLPSYCLDRACFTSGENAQYRLSVRAEVAATLVAEGPGAISAPPEEYLVRRLTPLECCRLQGFPDGWTEHLGTEEPGEQEIARWVGVFEDWYRAQGKAARASPGRVAKWLKDPHSDAAQYKAYGNSVAVPCVFFVLAGIAWAENRGDEA